MPAASSELRRASARAVAIGAGLASCVIAAACASNAPPPKELDPAASLYVPPMPPPSAAPSKTVTRDAPPVDPSAPAPAQEGVLNIPGPLALPCMDDAHCGTHRCNRQYGKCAFPCATNTDCIPGAGCMNSSGMGICVPLPPTSP